MTLLADRTLSRRIDRAVDPLAALKTLLPRIRRQSAAHDRDGAFPSAEVELLAQDGLLGAFAMPELGGAYVRLETRVDALFDCLRALGRVDLSLGRIFEGHVNAIVLIERYGAPCQRRALADQLAANAVFGVWNTEPAPGVALTETAGGWQLSGAKSYATGAGYIDHAVVTARLPGGAKQMLLLPVCCDSGRADPTVWRTSGMRATVSGHYDFTGFPLSREHVLGAPGDYEREPAFSGGAWRFAAVQLGGIEALTSVLREHLQSGTAGRDPVQRARFGRAVAAARSAYQWVREAARRVELAPTAGVVPFVLMTRMVVEDAAFQVIETVQRAIGTRAFFVDGPVDRMMRDLQLYLRQAAPDLALDRAAAAWLESDCWTDDPWW